MDLCVSILDWHTKLACLNPWIGQNHNKTHETPFELDVITISGHKVIICLYCAFIISE